MLEERIQELTAAIERQTAAIESLVAQQAPSTSSSSESTAAAEEPAKKSSGSKSSGTKKKSAAEETQAAKKSAKKAEQQPSQEPAVEEEPAAEAEQSDSADDDFDLDVPGAEEPAGDGPMGDDEFTEAWRDFTQRASKHATEQLGLDKEEAQREVKRHVVPLLKSFAGADKPKVSEVPADLRRQFLAKAEEFFNKESA